MSISSLRAAIGGAWSTHWVIWVGLFPVTLLFVLYREQALGPATVWWSVTSAIAQHIAVGLVVVVGGAILRRRRSILPVAVVATLWILACVTRALVTYAITSVGYAERSSPIADTLIWLAISVMWIPVTVLGVAEIDQRRLLLAARDITTDALITERAEAEETAQQLQARLLATVTAQLTPVLSDLHDSLNSARRRITSSTAAELGLRISRVHDETIDLVTADKAPAATDPEPQRATRVTFRRAFEIAAVPPARVAALVTLATIVGIVPDTARVYGAVASLQVAVAVIASGILLAALPALFAERASRGKGMTHLRATVILQGVAVAAAAVFLAVLPPSVWLADQWPVVPLTLLGFALAHTTYAIAFIVSAANADDDAALRAASAELDALRTCRAERSRLARERMAQLMHGPIQGRLAACVMALNFHAEIVTTDPARAETMLDSVLEHLQGVSAELQRLGAEADNDSPTASTKYP
ncbi:MAG: hypothetical protein ACXIUP_01755 [Microcella sp.]